MSKSTTAIDVQGLNLAFSYRPKTTLKKFVLDFALRKHTKSIENQIFRDFNLSIAKGTTLGVIGRNGTGKTTLLQVISGIIKPTSGRISKKGRILPLFAIGLGFDYNLTGLENIKLHANFYGQNTQTIMKDRLQSIVKFADIGDYAEAPVKYYSAGMVVRLGFAIVTHFEYDILLLDEIMHVGDADFAEKCKSYFEKIRQTDKTLIISSHNMDAIEKMCDQVVYMRGHGVDPFVGSPKEAISLYAKELHDHS